MTFHSERWVAKWLSSLLASDYPMEKLHLVVRDHSSDAFTLSAFEQELASKKIKLGSTRLYQAVNVGFGSGHNDIIHSSSHKFVLITNIDLEFHPNAISIAVSHAIADSLDVASWEFRQSPYEHPKYYDPYTAETWWSSSACVLVDRQKILGVGSYDRNIFMYGEDVDLSLRLKIAHYRLRYVPNAVVAHHTYSTPFEVKPLQMEGSLIASTRLKIKFGTLNELIQHAVKIIGLNAVTDLVISSAAKASWLYLKRQIWLWPIYRLRYPRLPFFGMDYELVRQGAFFSVEKSGEDSSFLDKPLVSIIVRTYGDRIDLCKGAVASIIRQTYRPIEVLLCEDGGDAIGRDIEQRLAPDQGLKLVLVPCPKGGRSKTANAGLRRASGEYIGFLDDDDALFADHVETVVKVIQQQSTARAGYAKAFEVEAAKRDEELYDVKFSSPQYFDIKYSYDRLLVTNLFPIQAVIFDRSLLQEAGLMDEDVDMLEDWNLWCRMAEFTDFLPINKTTSVYRVPNDPDEKFARLRKLNLAYESVSRLNYDFRRRRAMRTKSPQKHEAGVV